MSTNSRAFVANSPSLPPSSPAPSLSLSFSSLLSGHGGQSGPLSPNNAASPTNLTAVSSLIARSFSPRVAVFASRDADELAEDKGFSNILEIFRPFGDNVSGQIVVRDSQRITTTLDDFGIQFTTANFNPPSAAPSPVPPSQTGSASTGSASPRQSVKLKVQIQDPCFDTEDLDALIDLYLKRGPKYFAPDVVTSPDLQHSMLYYKIFQRLLAAPPIASHESFSHPVAAVIVISSRNPQPIETLSALYRYGNDAPAPPYLSKDYLRYYILIHDEDNSELDKSLALFERMKRHFGIHCHMTKLRSKKADLNSDDAVVQYQYSEWMSAGEEVEHAKKESNANRYLFMSDSENLKSTVRELVVQSLVPFMERCISTWNDQIAASRRGLTGRLFSASKRFLGASSKSNAGGIGSANVSGNYDPVNGYYGFMTAELQMRKLADYAFMLRDWKLAHSTYDILRKDFLNDKAWKYHAGAQEMAAASLILSGVPLSSKTRTDTLEPLLDSATFSYINRCSQPTYALRTLLISSELLRARGGGAADDAARWLLKCITDKLMGNLAHALLVERMSACYEIRKGMGTLNWGSRRRKAAFWQIVSAKQWVALGYKEHALACIDEASENVYDSLSWASEPGSLLADLRRATESIVYDTDV
ncbi:ER-golgi trafficking TRAPP I complex 85 kDa subunit-domain-containing protein [Dipodascopsis uninucleata]